MSNTLPCHQPIPLLAARLRFAASMRHRVVNYHVIRNPSARAITRVLRRRYASSPTVSRRKAPLSSTSYTPSSPTPPGAAFERSRALPWVLSSILAGGIAFYGGQLFVAARQPCTNPAVADLAAQQDVSERYEFTADTFDSEVGMSEMLMGVNGMRKSLARQCSGHVLEVSCGTGRNVGYYDIGPQGRVKSLTFVDLSPQMVDICRKKWYALLGSNKESVDKHLIVRFLPGSALESMPLAPALPVPRKYDTIIQTMGLCSTPTPTALLENMVRHLHTSSPDARIFLLEHGRSYMDWLNNILDNSAQKHAEIHGCWFNRDIGQVVADAAKKTGLEVVNERRYHFGTTWLFELKPKSRSEPESVQEASAIHHAEEGEPTLQSSGRWLPWLPWLRRSD